MNVHLTRTKILLPNRPASLLTRPRLIELLDAMLDYRLLLVTAPAGYGKTSLLVDLAHQMEMPVCWYALDPLDQDLPRFCAYLVAALAERFPGFGKRSEAFLADLDSSEGSIDQFVSVLVNEIYEHVREHFALVLDDYHLVSENRRLNQLVSRLVQLVDENCHLVISSRSLLALPELPLMVARSQVAGLGYEELAFRPDEVQALLEQNYELEMPGAAAEKLVRETEGWITGLLLSTETMWQGMSDRVRLARASGVGLYDYLVQQVLNQQPAAVRDFLLRTSFLDEFDAELCAEFLGPGPAWRELLDTVLRSNLFVLPVEYGGTWLRYHHLFRDFLQKQMQRENPDEARRLWQRLARVYLDRQDWERAYRVLERLGDRPALIDLVLQAGTALLKAGRLSLLAQWLDGLTAEELRSHPRLLASRGDIAVMQGDVARGLGLLNEAEQAFRSAGDLAEAARVLVQRAMARQFQGRYSEALADADAALELVKDDPRLRPIMAGAQRAKGMGQLYAGELTTAASWLEEALCIYRELGEQGSVALVQMELGLVAMNTGRYAVALGHYQDALDHWRSAGHVIHQAALFNNLGVLYHLTGQYEEAVSQLEEAVACADKGGFARAKAAALAGIGDLYSDVGALDAARHAYDEACSIAKRIDDRFLLLYIALAESRLAQLEADYYLARRRLDQVQPLGSGSSSPYEHGLWHLAQGRLALAEKRYALAERHLVKAAQPFEQGGQQPEGARTHLLLGAALLGEGDRSEAKEHLERALRQAAFLDTQHALVPLGRESFDLLEAFRNDAALGHAADHLTKQVIEFEQSAPALRKRIRARASAIEIGQPSLQIQGMGTTLVTLQGKPVADPDWQSRKAVREFFFLILAHPEGLTKEEIGEILWPDSSAAQQKLRFKNNVYRVRRALGQEVILFDGSLYQFNQALDFAYDVATFLERYKAARETADPLERADAWSTMVDLYRGPYLPDIDGIWVWPEREHLSRLFEEVILALATYHFARGEHPLALAMGQRALAHDPYLEEAHRLLMQVHAARGNRAAVTRQYQRCERLLAEEMRTPPSPQTVELYRLLTG